MTDVPAMQPFTNDDWATLDIHWRRVLAPRWVDVERLSEAQLVVVGRALRETRSLELGRVHERCPSLAPLRRLEQLRELSLSAEHLDAGALASVAELTELHGLCLAVYGDTWQDRHDLETLASLRELRRLETCAMPLQGIEALGELTQLRALHLEHRGRFSTLADGPVHLPVERLRKLEQLTIIGHVGSLSVLPQSLAHLGQLHWLELTDTREAPIYEAAALAELSLLRWLHLDNTQLCTLGGLIDAPLELLELAALPTTVPESEVLAFSRLHPRCEIHWSDHSGRGERFEAGVCEMRWDYAKREGSS
jgi:hypothetical protein